jgi:hypothetical protein
MPDQDEIVVQILVTAHNCWMEPASDPDPGAVQAEIREYGFRAKLKVTVDNRDISKNRHCEEPKATWQSTKAMNFLDFWIASPGHGQGRNDDCGVFPGVHLRPGGHVHLRSVSTALPTHSLTSAVSPHIQG